MDARKVQGVFSPACFALAKSPAFTIASFDGSIARLKVALTSAGVTAWIFFSSASSKARVRPKYVSSASSFASWPSLARSTLRSCTIADFAFSTSSAVKPGSSAFASSSLNAVVSLSEFTGLKNASASQCPTGSVDLTTNCEAAT